METAIALRKAHPDAAVMAPAVAPNSDAVTAHVAAMLECGERASFPDIGGGVIYWLDLPDVGLVRVHLKREAVLPPLGTMVTRGDEVWSLDGIEDSDDPKIVLLVWTVNAWMRRKTVRERVVRATGMRA
jgi:hypothetical protein